MIAAETNPAPIVDRQRALTLQRGAHRLEISVRYNGEICAIVFHPSRSGKFVAYAAAEARKCRIQVDCIWIGTASFDMEPAELKRLRALLPEIRVAP